MANAARAIHYDAVSERPLPLARPRCPGKVVQLHRASRAAHVFSEIAKAHITHPLPDQLQLAEEDLRAALEELLTMKVEAPAEVQQLSERSAPSRSERFFVFLVMWAFTAMMTVNAFIHFGVL